MARLFASERHTGTGNVNSRIMSVMIGSLYHGQTMDVKTMKHVLHQIAETHSDPDSEAK